MTSMDSLASYLNNLCREDYDLNALISVLKDLLNVIKLDNYRTVLSSNNWSAILSLSHIVKKILCKDSLINEELDFLAEYFRFLRNASGGGVAENQQFIISCNELLDVVKNTLNIFKDKASEKEVIVLKCCIQLIGNLVCSRQEAKVIVWNHFVENRIFQCLFKHKNHTVREYTMMVLYNCMSDTTAEFIISNKDGHQILMLLLSSLCGDLVDWGLLLLEIILKHEKFFENCYELLPLQSRLLILDIILEQLNNGSDNTYFNVPISSINFIKELYIDYVMNIVKICTSEASDMKPLEIARLLGVLCNASVLDAYCMELKSCRRLLETSVDILRCVHLLGKKSSNAFTCISSLKILNKNDKEAIESNPSYGFKKNLIRLIGNLCFNCRNNQDVVRHLDGIPLLLDCCNLDARNPFITQWGILAIRNIMERNPDNQAVLASISVTGDLADSALIKEMGFEISNENGKFVLKSLQS